MRRKWVSEGVAERVKRDRKGRKKHHDFAPGPTD